MNTQTSNISQTESQSKPMSTGWRYTLSALLLITSGTSAVYLIFGRSELRQTSAFFIGLPLLVGLLTINLTRTQGLYGQVLRANVIGLTIIAPLLGEGSICLLMAAPLFIGISMLVAVIYKVVRSSLVSVIIIPVLLLGVIEQYTTILTPLPETVTTTVEVVGSLETWRNTVRTTVPIAENPSFFLGLGFPLPSTYLKNEDTLTINFQTGNKATGAWHIQPTTTPDGVVFKVLSDSSPIQEWVQVIDSQVIVQSTANGTVRLTQTTHFQPLLSPLWYFRPLQRYAIEQTHRLALDSWELAVVGQTQATLTK